MKTSTTTRRRSPRFATTERQSNGDSGSTLANKENDTKQASFWNETNFDPYESSGKGDGNLKKSTKQDKKRPAATEKTRRHDDGHQAATAPANARGVASRTRSNHATHENSSIVETRTVSFGQETQSANKRGRGAAVKNNSGSLVTPASPASAATHASLLDPTLQAPNTRGMSTVTPHEREASLALATLCMQSDMNQHLGTVSTVNMPLKKSTTLSPRKGSESLTETETPEPSQASRTSSAVETSLRESPKRNSPASSTGTAFDVEPPVESRDAVAEFSFLRQEEQSGTATGPDSMHLVGSPILFDGIHFSSLDPMPLPVQQVVKLPPLAEDGDLSGVPANITCDRSAKRIRMTLYDGQSLHTSPIDAYFATFDAPNSVVVENIAQSNVLSPMDRLTAPEDRVPPPLHPSSASSSVGSIPTPLSFNEDSFSDGLLDPLVGFADALSSAVGLEETLFRDL